MRKTSSVVDCSELQAFNVFREVLGLAPNACESGRVVIAGELSSFPGPLAIDDLAVSVVTAATLVAAQLLAERNGGPPDAVTVSSRHAAASFLTDALVQPDGWEVPPSWDPIAGDYLARDGWIRLHTNYAHHRDGALRALGVELDETDASTISAAEVAALVAEWSAEDLERAVAKAGGVAGAQHTAAEWNSMPQGVSVGEEPLLATVQIRPSAASGSEDASPRRRRLPVAVRPFDGVRVLDLTRVLAGPVATGFLAAWGADVLRVDPPGFEEVPGIVPLSTAGKRTTELDLVSKRGRDRLAELVATADVVVHGYRRGALSGLGIDPDEWCGSNPGLVVASLNAYGLAGDWSERRGFDSIVQHSVGITDIGQRSAEAERPVPMPCQALDYGCGWLLAGAVGSALIQRCRAGTATSVHTSLARFARLVLSLPRIDDVGRTRPTFDEVSDLCVTASTAWGPLERLPWPGQIGSLRPLMGSSGPIRAGEPRWLDQ